VTLSLLPFLSNTIIITTYKTKGMPYTIELCDDNGRAVAERVWKAPPRSNKPYSSTPIVPPTSRRPIHSGGHSRRATAQAIPQIARVARSIAKKPTTPAPVRYTTPPLQIRKGVNNVALSLTSRNKDQSHLRSPSMTSSDSESSSQSSASPRTPSDHSESEIEVPYFWPPRDVQVDMLETDISSYFYQLEESMQDPFTLMQGYQEPCSMREEESYLFPLDSMSGIEGC